MTDKICNEKKNQNQLEGRREVISLLEIFGRKSSNFYQQMSTKVDHTEKGA